MAYAKGEQVLGMDPVVDVLVSKGPFALGYLVLVVGENVVHPAGMNVEPLAQIFGCHGGAFYVPTGKSLAPGTIPLHVPARFGALPQSEVPGVPLQRVGLYPHPFQQISADVAGQLTVVGKSANVEVDVASGQVSIAV